MGGPWGRGLVEGKRQDAGKAAADVVGVAVQELLVLFEMQVQLGANQGIAATVLEVPCSNSSSQDMRKQRSSATCTSMHPGSSYASCPPCLHIL